MYHSFQNIINFKTLPCAVDYSRDFPEYRESLCYKDEWKEAVNFFRQNAISYYDDTVEFDCQT